MAYKDMRDHDRHDERFDTPLVSWMDVTDLEHVGAAVFWLRACLDYIEQLTGTSNFDAIATDGEVGLVK